MRADVDERIGAPDAWRLHRAEDTDIDGGRVVAAAVTIAAMLVLFWSVFLATIWLFGSSVLQPLVDTDVQAIQAWFAALVPT